MTQKLGTTPTQSYGKPSVAKFDAEGSYNQFDRVEWQGAVYGCKQDGTKGSADEPLEEPQDHPETWELLYGYRFTGEGVTSTTSDHIEIAGGGGSGYTLPVATDTVLGGVKIGTDTALSIDTDGTLNNTEMHWTGKNGIAEGGFVRIIQNLGGLTLAAAKINGETKMVLSTHLVPLRDAYISSTQTVTKSFRPKIIPADGIESNLTITGMPSSSLNSALTSILSVTVTEAIGLNHGDPLLRVVSNLSDTENFSVWAGCAMDALLVNLANGTAQYFMLGFSFIDKAVIIGELASDESVTIEAGNYLLILS